ncbi:PHA/PHB synthase family protein [Pseudonocardia acaciae]|uniref:PHA/PHB synthase family protein n=1 Tax=Pseudonocardia acaciae TaxID=551276 RepID=UPI00055A9B35|nr:alpha/beta fold hydrolase [Pseudonocardia acaciae]
MVSEPVADWVARRDPAGFGGALFRAGASLAGRPFPVATATLDYLSGTLDSLARALDDGPEPANAWFALCGRQHALLARYLRALASTAELDRDGRRKVDFAVEQLVEALAPSNFPLTNPTVLRRALDTGGKSLVLGARNMVRDLVTNHGAPRQVTPGRFRVGRDLACTPGKVVFRNRLVELIQYEPRTETVHRVPMLFSPPWINKYYILDLAPGRSLVDWAVRHGHTCFALSYRNPDEGLRGLDMSDYLREGPLAALAVIAEITGEPEANVVALCLGGTLAGASAAWLAARGEPGVASLTLMNTLLDFAEPGPLAPFTDQRAVWGLERVMRRAGYLPAEWMKATFDALRPAELVWNYVVSGWLLGEEPVPLDLLAWNADATRMPAAMQREYLRGCYLENRLATGRMELAGERLDLGRVRQDAYLVAAEADHIAPWRSVYAGARLLGGRVRFVLSNAGHIAGVVNPPGSDRSRYLSVAPDELPADAEGWRRRARERAASWWEDWTPWIAARAGGRRRPPPTGSRAHPPLADAPGLYVHSS